MTTTTVSIDAEGNVHSQEQISSHGGVSSSSNVDTGGISYHTPGGAGVQQTHDLNSIPDNAVIKVEGMEMTVAQARQYGVMPNASMLNENPAQSNPQVLHEAPTSNEPLSESAQISEALKGAVDGGQLDPVEANAYDTSFAQLELAGLDVQSAIDIHHKHQEGSLAHGEVSQEDLGLISEAHSQIASAATETAQREMSPEEFAWVTKITDANPELYAEVQQYALDRATGGTKATWRDVVVHLKSRTGAR